MEWFNIALCALICAIFFYYIAFAKREPNQRQNYGYGLRDGPHTWTDKFNLANCHHQSPVNIDSRSVRNTVSQKRSLLGWAHFEELPQSMHLKTTEHTVELWPSYRCCPPLIHWKTGLNSTGVFHLNHLVFRWKSEHTIDNEQFPLEMQSYFHLHNHPAAANTQIVVVANLFSESPHSNLYLEPICMHLNSIVTNGRPTNSSCLQPILPFPVAWLCPEFKQGFYDYTGSLTVPPCAESVTWLVNAELFSISHEQLYCFKRLYNSCGSRILTNQRPVQPLNDRLVTFNQIE